MKKISGVVKSVLLLSAVLVLLWPAPARGATFPGTGTGAIPDGLTGTPPQYGTPQVISFTAAGLSAPVQNVAVSVTLTHTWVGDVDMVLTAPNGTSAQVIGHVGVTTAGSFGDSSNYSGAYDFRDSAPGNFWTVATAAACGDTCNVTPGAYRASAKGQTGQTNPPPVVNLTAAFAALNTTQLNGVWTLTVRDGANQDTGSTSSATLDITAGGDPGPNAPVDFDGNGRTDFSVVRNTGGGPNGQVTWYTAYNGAAGGRVDPWGTASDFFVPGDYDGDGKDDLTVFRNGAPATWFILQSATTTVRIDSFGLTGDDPRVIGDYNGDGKDDIAVYRAGAVSGDPSYWFYRTAPGSAYTAVQWGQNGDFPAPGDYDGDNKTDFAIQRNGGGGRGVFWRMFSGGGSSDIVFFGNSLDVVVPGDYDGDGRDDLATVRGVAGVINWFYRPSAGGADVQLALGASATDFPTHGDYDGDGKTDIAIWHPSAAAGQSFFMYRSSVSGTNIPFTWGQNGDYPIANSFSH